MEVGHKIDIKIRVIILFEYYARAHRNSKNPEMHFFKIPELKEIDNQIIASNAIYLIDRNFVRGGVDIERNNTFPWITRILPKGTTFVEQIVTRTQNISEIKDEQWIQDKTLSFVSNNMRNEIPVNVIDIAGKLF